MSSDMFWGIVGNLIAAAIAAAIGYSFGRIQTALHLIHVNYLKSEYGRVKIVLPALIKAAFPVGHLAQNARIPDNIPLMPMAEGKGLAHLVFALRQRFDDATIEYVTPRDFVDDGTPFVCLGGPSVNTISGQILALRALKFELKYPDHIATYGAMIMDPHISDDNELQEDFGFLLQSTSRIGTKCIVVCGVWATGSELACQAYADRLPSKSTAHVGKHLLGNSHVFIILHAPLGNCQLGAATLVAVDDLSLGESSP